MMNTSPSFYVRLAARLRSVKMALRAYKLRYEKLATPLWHWTALFFTWFILLLILATYVFVHTKGISYVLDKDSVTPLNFTTTIRKAELISLLQKYAQRKQDTVRDERRYNNFVDLTRMKP